ncbi:PH domain protein [Aspergillus melleus]|uniref:PH domain protein n=1 Tax=Aspergillus melleus TaxID=138277 RepID=UPI001E8DA9B1|nr:uncharacterized protein LDX57_009411 [Aspergillus melleus]KAH8431758.1 hypothetical protein LDX57_009411 [Aspergillus melleus]
MVRSRVLSFISAFGGPSRKDTSGKHNRTSSASFTLNTSSPSRVETSSTDTPTPPDASPTGVTTIGERRASRPGSALFSHDPPFMELSGDTPAELQPIFNYLNSHANKLYHEGYFLKLNDLDNHGRPCADRQWVECYAQLVGTALSLWDAAALDAAGEEGDVAPTFINLADASIKMIETLPTRNQATPALKNVLSICSAGQNRYLLHFNSFHSLTQWTAAIRLSLFEHTSLYEAYTGSIIAGKGKHLNNIRSILERSRFKHEDWARVRFGAGTPWRRCWFVVTPPNEKEFQKAQKSLKKKSAYDRAPKLVLGDIKFYETKKTKKVKPIATITNAYSAYAIYPQSKPLIDQSTLVKIEGTVTIHTQPESTSEGFVFVMPEAHPAVPGFEMMIRFLIPTFDTFNLYGRPTRLIAATNHIKSIMFAFPNERRYGYLDILDIAGLMQTPGSQNWTEAEWRQQLKEATSRRMAAGGSRTSSMSGSKPRFRSSLPNRYSHVPGGPSQRSNATYPDRQAGFNQSTDAIVREEPADESFSPALHSRVNSDITGMSPLKKPPQASFAESSPSSSAQDIAQQGKERPGNGDFNDQSSSESDSKQQQPDPQAEAIGQQFRSPSPPSPVVIPPAFTHGPGEMPSTRPQPSPDLKKANRMSNATLTQLVAASGNKNLLRTDSPAGSQGSGSAYSHEPSPQQTVPDSPYFSNEEQIDLGPIIFDSPAARVNRTYSGRANGPNFIQLSKSTRRKPLPSQQNKDLNIPSPVGEPSFDDLRHTMDEDAFNRIGANPSLPSPDKDTHQDEESVYDDASTTSPDYASTRGSVYSKRSVRSAARPRMGVMKTVGTAPSKDVVIGDAHYSLDKPLKGNPDIPSIDFGPTLTYLPTTGRPTTSDTLKNWTHQRSDSDATERQRISVPTHPMDRAHSRSPSQDEFRRSVLWQPGMAGARPTTPGGGLSAEQFVQQRAAPSPPVHMHHRNSSTSPPPVRPVSGDWTGHSRSQSQMNMGRDGPPPRPHSRGANSMMNMNDISSHLSAREQEHVARMTGSSFFNISTEKKKHEPQVNPMGLVGAIDAREREKKGIMEGMSNQMVQHAIAQRQHHFQHQQPAPTPQPNPYETPNARHSVYNIPTASRTWDALNQPYRPEEPRRQSWYGQLGAAQQPPAYQQSQLFSQHPGHYGNTNAMHY